MFEEEFVKIPTGDQREFSRVINVLLLKSFIVRDIFDAKEKIMRINSDYRFIERYFPLFENYLKYSGWHIEKDDLSGVVSLTNEYQENQTRLDRETSLLLFALRMIYEDEKKDGSQTNTAIYITTPGLLKALLDHGIQIPGKKLTGRQIARSLRFFASHNIISKVSGTYDEGDVSFYILPSIAYALDNEKIVAMSEALDEINKTDENLSNSQLGKMSGEGEGYENIDENKNN
ncbi:MAG: DUF4194 domain-containing protein [Acholeplasmataceae bacterium]